MEVISTTNTQLRDLTMTQHRQDAEINHFRAVFDEAMSAQMNPQEGSVLDRAALRKAAEDFESYFLQLMFREMRRTTLNENSFIPKSHAEQIFTEMLDEQVSKDAASAGGLGLADMIYKQMTQRWE